MKIRVLSAIIGILILVPFIVAGGWAFAWFMYLLGSIGLFELARMKRIDYLNMVGVVATCALGVVLLPQHYALPLVPSSVNPDVLFYIAGLILLAMTVYHRSLFNFEDAAVLMFGALYIGFGFRFLIMMRDMGIETLLFMFALIWATDTGAYMIGRQFGKHKLAPKVSPNKTIEGSIGGVLSAVVVAIVYIACFKPNLDTTHYIMLTISVSIAGQLGDLVESAYKRHFGVKDSGKLLPGHGGVLDRFDSLIFASFMFMIWINLLK